MADDPREHRAPEGHPARSRNAAPMAEGRAWKKRGLRPWPCPSSEGRAAWPRPVSGLLDQPFRHLPAGMQQWSSPVSPQSPLRVSAGIPRKRGHRASRLSPGLCSQKHLERAGSWARSPTRKMGGRGHSRSNRYGLGTLGAPSRSIPLAAAISAKSSRGLWRDWRSGCRWRLRAGCGRRGRAL